MAGRSDEALPLEAPHWSFAIELDGRPGVSEACLLLQDEVGVDVNILLFALYAVARRRIVLGTEQIEELDRAVATWRSEVILPLRALRRRLKTGPLPAPSKASEILRIQIKGAELRAEQIEQAMLAQWLEASEGGGEASLEVGGLLNRVVSVFAEQSGRDAVLEDRRIRQALATIAAAVAPS